MQIMAIHIPKNLLQGCSVLMEMKRKNKTTKRKANQRKRGVLLSFFIRENRKSIAEVDVVTKQKY